MMWVAADGGEAAGGVGQEGVGGAGTGGAGEEGSHLGSRGEGERQMLRRPVIVMIWKKVGSSLACHLLGRGHDRRSVWFSHP